MKKNIILTFDIDWAPDWMVKPIIEIIKKKKINSHFFLTHKSDLFLKKENYIDIGLHPNFFSNSTQGKNTKQIIKNLKKIYRRANTVRTHGNFQSINLHILLSEKYNIKIDCSTFAPRHDVLSYNLLWKKKKIQILSYNWEDGYEANQTKKIFSLKHKFFNDRKIKLYILNFHPIHIFLNTRDSKVYNKMKNKFPDINKTTQKNLEEFINKKKTGAKNFFESLINSENINFLKIADFNKTIK